MTSHRPPPPPDPTLTPDIIARLYEGITAGWAGDRMGCSRVIAARVLQAYGARYSNGRWRRSWLAKGEV